MNNIIIKRVFAVSAFLTLAVTATAQDLTSYFITDAVDRKSHNAAFAPDRGYFNIPLVGNINLSTTGNISLDDMLFSYDGALVPLIDTRISAQDALSGLESVNDFGVSSRISILGFGAYCRDGKSFWSFDLNLRTSASMSMPYELFDFIKTAPESASIQNINLYTESYAEAAFGYSRPVNDKLTVGGRVKVLMGLFNASLNIDNLDVRMNSDVWDATASGTLDINAKGIAPVVTTDENGRRTYELDDLEGSLSAPAGVGAAVDFGATYDFTDKLQLSLAVNDLGFIAWSKDNNTSASVSNNFSFSGAQISMNEDGTESDDGVSFDDLEFEAEESVSDMKWLQANINAGAEYSFLGNRIGVGAIYSARFWRTNTIHNLTTAVTLRPAKWFNLALSYAFTNNDANAVGLAANIATGFINLYVSTDILTSRKSAQYIPIEQSTMNVSFGLAVPIGRKGERREGI